MYAHRQDKSKHARPGKQHQNTVGTCVRMRETEKLVKTNPTWPGILSKPIRDPIASSHVLIYERAILPIDSSRKTIKNTRAYACWEKKNRWFFIGNPGLFLKYDKRIWKSVSIHLAAPWGCPPRTRMLLSVCLSAVRLSVCVFCKDFLNSGLGLQTHACMHARWRSIFYDKEGEWKKYVERSSYVRVLLLFSPSWSAIMCLYVGRITSLTHDNWQTVAVLFLHTRCIPAS